MDGHTVISLYESECHLLTSVTYICSIISVFTPAQRCILK